MIPLAVLTWFRTNPRNIFLIGGLIAIVGVLLFVYMRGRSDMAAKDAARQRIAVATAIKQDDKADNVSTWDMVRNAIVIDAKKKELEDAVAKIPDSVPAPVAVAAGCVELRQHGISTTDLPSCPPPGQ